MQRTRVRALAWENPTCCGATKPVRHNSWACTLEPASHNYWARVPKPLKSVHLEPVLHNREATAMRSPCTAMKSRPCSPQLEKACAQQRRPNTAKKKRVPLGSILINPPLLGHRKTLICLQSLQIWFVNPRFHIKVYIMYSFMSAFFLSAYFFWNLSILMHIAVIYSFLLLCNIPQVVYLFTSRWTFGLFPV